MFQVLLNRRLKDGEFCSSPATLASVSWRSAVLDSNYMKQGPLNPTLDHCCCMDPRVAGLELDFHHLVSASVLASLETDIVLCVFS